jgi:RNA polymerase sigma-70 factor (ECF subfamily)
LLGVASGRKGHDSLEDVILRSNDELAPEIELLRKSHLTEFRASLSLALATLDPRERALLRYAIVEALGIATLGRMYGVSRATAASWLQAAREKLELHVTQNLGERLRVSDRSLVSAVRYITSQLDRSLTRALAE